MAASAEIKRVSYLLDKVVTNVAEINSANGLVSVSQVNEGTELLLGVCTYQTRAVGTENRLLTLDITTQPSLVVRDKDGVKPIPYAEDVISHPSRDWLKGVLARKALKIV
ncbi:hypothetical protein HYS95_03050 [Candidatus Daviesbacteria bacterium]|nr:hypothetical protein [Candidatus Daviesbacteria bacterium]